MTGSARRPGRSIPVALAAAGADIVVGLRSTDSTTDVIENITALGRPALPSVFWPKTDKPPVL